MNLEKIEKEIEDILSKSPIKIDPIHSKTTREWLLKLKPDADEALQIAALAHDIERAYISDEEGKKGEEDSDNYIEYKKQHSQRSAKIITDMLKKHGFIEPFIKRVGKLVLNHEFGGDPESDILRDADSISFFENNLEYYLKRHGKETTKLKIKFMYDRMSTKAKQFLKSLKYDDKELQDLLKKLFSD
jgi:hypothetical protein